MDAISCFKKDIGGRRMKWRNRRQMFSGNLTMVFCTCKESYWSYGAGQDVLDKCWELVNCRCEA